MEKAGEWEKAVDTIAEMTCAGLTPHHHCWCSAINAAKLAGQWQVALDLWSDAQEYGIVPDVVLFTSMIHAALVADRLEEGLAN